MTRLPLISVKRAASMLDATPAYVRGLIRAGKLKALCLPRARDGRRAVRPSWRVYPESLSELIGTAGPSIRQPSESALLARDALARERVAKWLRPSKPHPKSARSARPRRSLCAP